VHLLRIYVEVSDCFTNVYTVHIYFNNILLNRLVVILNGV